MCMYACMYVLYSPSDFRAASISQHLCPKPWYVKTTRQHQELRALIFFNKAWVLLRPTEL